MTNEFELSEQFLAAFNAIEQKLKDIEVSR